MADAVENRVWCEGCGVEVTWGPFLFHGRCFCCRDCADGRECQCDFPEEEPAEEGKAGAART